MRNPPAVSAGNRVARVSIRWREWWRAFVVRLLAAVVAEGWPGSPVRKWRVEFDPMTGQNERPFIGQRAEIVEIETWERSCKP
jgi:hypothetical protein